LKLANKRILRAKSRIEAAYYANHSARRFSNRFNDFSRKLKALSQHLRTQRKELRDADAPFTGFDNWASILARHKRRFNLRFAAMTEAANQRQIEYEALRREEVETAVQARLLEMCEN
jgi:ABC-type transporter Mla subunit MlaD